MIRIIRASLYHWKMVDTVQTKVYGSHEKLAGTADIFGNCTNISGDASGLIGYVSGNLKGDTTGIQGNISGVFGNLDSLDITDHDRIFGIQIANLITRS